MAQLNDTTPWTAAQSRAQYVAIARLRWHMLLNGFRRKGGTGELVGRILLYPILFGMAFGPSILVGVLGYLYTRSHDLGNVRWLLWGTFAYCQLLNIQLGQPGSTFDPTELIRFPLSVRNYVSVRLCFGLLSPANVIGSLMSAAVAFGVMLAAPGLWLYATVALVVFAVTNVLFSRMVFAWVDRWLSTRRAREAFTGLIFVFSLGIQWVNFTFNPAYNHGHSSLSPETLQRVQAVYHRVQPLLQWLPPELTTTSMQAADHADLAQYALLTLACALYAAAFYLVFAMRMRTEFRGESLSDAANAVPRNAKKAAPARPVAAVAVPSSGGYSFGLSPVVQGMLHKEFLYLRRHTGMLYGLIMPIFLVLIIASRFATRGSASWVFPAAVAYTLLAVSAFSYNAFGFEGSGVQFYFLAPVRLRDVMLAKNLLNFAMAGVEILATFALIVYLAGMPSWPVALATLLWAAATLLLNTAMGNTRSITTPKKVNPQRMANKQVSQLSALIGMGILLVSSAVAAVLGGLAFYFQMLWALVPAFTFFAGIAFFVYERSLRGIDRFAHNHRDQLFEELCKAG